MKQRMAFTKKLISGILLLSLLLQPLLCSELYSSPAQLGLTNLEQLMTDLQNDSLTQRILAQNLQESLENANQQLEIANQQLSNANSTAETLKNSLDEALELQETQSKLLKKQDIMCNVLKWSLVIGIPIAFTAGLTIGWKVKGWTS